MTARLLSRLSTRQVEGVLRADAAANEVDAAIRQLWLGLLNHLGPTPNAAQIRNTVTLFFKRLPTLAAHETGAALTKSATWGHQTAAEALTLALPTNVLATAAAMRPRTVREDFVSQPGVIAMSYDSQTGNLKLRDRAGRLREPVRDKLSPERQRQIFRDLLFPPPDLATVRDIVFSRFDGATFEDRLARAASLGDAEKIASGVAFAFAGGKNIRQIAKDILPMVDGVRSAARRIARTDSMRVINRSNFDAQNGLGDLIVGWRVAAILDQHSRPWHAARHGRSYLKTPGPGQKGLAQMPHPPEEPEDERERPSGSPRTAWNCRCTLIPIVRPPARENAPDPPPVFRQDQGALIPDGSTYGDWWKQADDRRRKIAVGVRRYLTMLDRLQREPDWIEFMDPDTGGLLSVDQLKAETVSERNERVGKMRAVIGERRDELAGGDGGVT